MECQSSTKLSISFMAPLGAMAPGEEGKTSWINLPHLCFGILTSSIDFDLLVSCHTTIPYQMEFEDLYLYNPYLVSLEFGNCYCYFLKKNIYCNYLYRYFDTI